MGPLPGRVRQFRRDTTALLLWSNKCLVDMPIQTAPILSPWALSSMKHVCEVGLRDVVGAAVVYIVVAVFRWIWVMGPVIKTVSPMGPSEGDKGIKASALGSEVLSFWSSL